jgi:hypothetical protein
MYNLRKQRGVTIWGWLVILLLIAFFTMLAVKIIPLYLDGYKVVTSITSLKNDSNAHGKTPRELRELLMKRLDINMVTDLGRDDIYISKERNGYRVEVDYVKQEKIFGNLSVVVEFNESVVVPET